MCKSNLSLIIAQLNLHSNGILKIWVSKFHSIIRFHVFENEVGWGHVILGFFNFINGWVEISKFKLIRFQKNKVWIEQFLKKQKKDRKTWFLFSCVKFGSFIWMCDLMSRRFGNSAGEKYGVRVSWTFSHFSSESGHLDRL